MKLKDITVAFLMAAVGGLFAGCTQQKPTITVLDFSGATDHYRDSPAKPDYTFVPANSSYRFTDNMLNKISAMIIPYSVLNRFDYRQLNFIRRFLESGAGIVAIKDTLLFQPDSPWLNSWKQLLPDPGSAGTGRVKFLKATYSDIEWQQAVIDAIGSYQLPDRSAIATLPVPDSNYYARIVLSEGFDEPMQMAILPGNNVLIAERKGALKLYSANEQSVKTVANFSVFSGIEDGLLGICADPGFEKNHFIYFCYSLPGTNPVNRLSRFQFVRDSLITSSEKVLLEYPTQRRYCCHSAGYITFDTNGNLYLSTGDNTNAEETEGYTPVDERPGRELSDDQATAANTMDLRGKILRIHPEPNGSYSIPPGNLFPGDGKTGRPEIFVMGCRNPFRLSVDPKNGYVYWGDVGPDTKVLSEDGLMSFDEFNQAKKPGFFGWPYFLADNKVFPHYNYATKTMGPGKDPKRPMNLSPHNSGSRELPPSQPAMIWYNKSASLKFPLVGKGGASAMAGPVYYRDRFPGSRYRLPDYYDGKLLVYDWVRRWLMAVSFDEQGNYQYMEPFLDHLAFNAPIDMKFAPDGALYILEYGTNAFARNADARLTRVEFQEGNRDPVPVITLDKQYGEVPLKVRLSANGSRDFDGDSLQYEWKVGNDVIHSKSTDYTFTSPGIHTVELTVSDSHKGTAARRVSVYAGNSAPVVRIHTTANRSFYRDHEQLAYRVTVLDKDDPNIDTAAIRVHFGYIPHGSDAAVLLASGDTPQPPSVIKGKALVSSLDCKTCHLRDGNSAGPSYQSVAARYAGDGKALSRLTQKIIKGGAGNWGSRAMPSHPDLTEADAKSIVDYILSTASKTTLPAAGTLSLNRPAEGSNEGVYLLVADYQDKGANGMPALAARDYLMLRNPLVEAETFDEGTVSLNTVTTLFLTYARCSGDGYMKFNSLDLNGIRGIDYRVQCDGYGGQIEMRLDSLGGTVVSRIDIPQGTSTDPRQGWIEVPARLSSIKGFHTIYFVFKATDSTSRHLFNLDWLRFRQ